LSVHRRHNQELAISTSGRFTVRYQLWTSCLCYQAV